MCEVMSVRNGLKIRDKTAVNLKAKRRSRQDYSNLKYKGHTRSMQLTPTYMHTYIHTNIADLK